MNSIQFKTNELLIFHSGCHGNQVSIVTIKWLMPIAPINLHNKYELDMI